MKNVLLGLFSALLLLSGVSASAQFVTSNGNKDTSIGFYDPASLNLYVHNDIIPSTTSPVYIKWHVVDYSFGPGWDIVTSGFCDNISCRSALDSFNNIFTNHTIFKSDEYKGSVGDFKMSFNTATAPADGTSSWVKIYAIDTVSGMSRTLTYIAYKNSTGISTTINSSDDVVLYPNPAREAINVIFDSKAGIKTIAIYNLIGKLVSPIYRPSGNSSAKIEINDYPAGIYFIRLMNGNGQVIATRRFVHQ